MSNQDWITPKAEIRESLIFSGKGLFAIEDIKEGEEVVVWGDSYVNKEKAEEAEKEGELVMQWDSDIFTIEDRGEDIGYYINHSCEPNLWMANINTLTAMRDIKAEEEITADYALWEADESEIKNWECKCSSPLCRKKITGKDWQSKELQERYKGRFSPLINKRIEQK